MHQLSCETPSLSTTPQLTSSGSGVLMSAFRERIVFWFAVVVVIAASPYIVIQIFRDHYDVSAAIAVMVIALSIDAAAIFLKKTPPIAIPLLMIPMAVGAWRDALYTVYSPLRPIGSILAECKHLFRLRSNCHGLRLRSNAQRQSADGNARFVRRVVATDLITHKRIIYAFCR